MPAREIRPYVGRKLYRLLALAGLLSEFTVSVPSEVSTHLHHRGTDKPVPNTANEAAIAAPVPPELPPGVLLKS